MVAHELFVEVDHLRGRVLATAHRVGPALWVPEVRRGAIERVDDVARIPRGGHALVHHRERLVHVDDRGGEVALVAGVRRELAVARHDDLLQRHVRLARHTQCLRER